MLTSLERPPAAASAHLEKLPTGGRIIKFPSEWEFMQHEYETSSKLLSWLLFLLNGVCVGHLVSQGYSLLLTLAAKAVRYLSPRGN
ncbi:MAG: hypothetical protein ACTS6G_02940 [Candidatus Hodgkinia cicadicola]